MRTKSILPVASLAAFFLLFVIGSSADAGCRLRRNCCSCCCDGNQSRDNVASGVARINPGDLVVPVPCPSGGVPAVCAGAWRMATDSEIASGNYFCVSSDMIGKPCLPRIVPDDLRRRRLLR
jgi:hypothetical protein